MGVIACNMNQFIKYRLYHHQDVGTNGRYFAGETVKCILLTENTCHSVEIALKFVPSGPTDKTVALI